MRIPRIWIPATLSRDAVVALPAETVHYLRSVLRLAVGAEVVVFDGEGIECRGLIARLGRQDGAVHLTDVPSEPQRESPLAITLLQGISRGERMDLVMQKAVELGVARIVPVLCARTGVHLSGERAAKRQAHWQGILAHAAAQCGRARLPALAAPLAFTDALALPAQDTDLRLMLEPTAETGLDERPAPASVALLIGPEGGLDSRERILAREHDFHGIRLGPRILRTETAALAAISVLQSRWGDLR